MMRNKLILILLLLPIVATAQIKFGHISYAEICQQMPQYEVAQKQLAELKAKYEKEATRSEEEFQRKFSDFLQGQKDFPANILQKRQAELQDVMERGIAFRQEAQDLLRRAEKTLMDDVYSQLNAAITAVAMQYGYAFVLNTDDNAAPYINPAMGDNVTDLVRVRLGIIKADEMTLPVPVLPTMPSETIPTTTVEDVNTPPVEAVPNTPTEAVPSTPTEAVPTTPTEAVPSTPTEAVPSTPVEGDIPANAGSSSTDGL
ncbi:MAG: OmpH family outer membrane protein [Bacteroidales bacterium]|nr:OmpH family outer membrane protein [Bacteroidales bacterium]